MRVLLITSRFPFPTWRGNQVRTAQWMDALAQHQVAVVAPQPESPGGSGELSQRGVTGHLYSLPAGQRLGGMVASVLGGWPLQEGLYRVRRGRQALAQALAAGPWDVAVVQMIRCAWAAEMIRSRCPGLPLLFDAIDAMGLHFERAVSDFPAPLRPLVRSEAARCRRREQWLVGQAALTTAVASRDLQALAPADGAGQVVPVAGRESSSAAQRAPGRTVLLSGNLGYRPTVRGALWFASQVWPRLHAALPDVRWVLAGARPVRAIRRLAALPGVEVHPDVPDLGPFLAAARVAIAPMASGSGVPMKVIEAWAAGVPVVADPWAAAGLEAMPEQCLEMATEPAQWLDGLLGLLSDDQRAAELGERGRAVWANVYRPQRVHAAVCTAVTTAAGSAADKPRGGRGGIILRLAEC